MISVSIPTTAKQDARLVEALAQWNAARVAHGDTPFADVNAMATYLLGDQLIGLVQSRDEQEAESVKAAYAQASPTLQNQIKSALGVS